MKNKIPLSIINLKIITLCLFSIFSVSCVNDSGFSEPYVAAIGWHPFVMASSPPLQRAGNDGGALEALGEVIGKSEAELLCSFTAFDAGIDAALMEPDRDHDIVASQFQKGVFEIGSALWRAAASGVSVRVVFDEAQSCAGDIPFLLSGLSGLPELAGFSEMSADDFFNNPGTISIAAKNPKWIEEVWQNCASPKGLPPSTNGRPHFLITKNKRGALRNNMCISDGRRAWIGSGGLSEADFQRPGFALTLHRDRPAGGAKLDPLLQEIERELRAYSYGVRGDQKEGGAFAGASLDGLHIELVFGPQGSQQKDPLERLAEKMRQSQVSAFYTSGWEGAPKEKNAAALAAIIKQKMEGGEIGAAYFSRPFDYGSFYLAAPGDAKKGLRGSPKSEAHIFLTRSFTGERETRDYTEPPEELHFFSGDLNGASPHDDSLLLSISFHKEDRPLSSFFESARLAAERGEGSQSGNTPLAEAGSVAVNEILWSGGCSNDTKKSPLFAFELFNKNPFPVWLENWRLVCGAGQSDLFAGEPYGPGITAFEFSPGSLIEAENYFVASTARAQFLEGDAILRQSGESQSYGDFSYCLLFSGDSQMDQVLFRGAPPFESRAGEANSRRGYSRCQANPPLAKGDPSEGEVWPRPQVRSMEKIDPSLEASKLTAWKSNSLRPSENSALPLDYRLSTFHTLGGPNSATGKGSDRAEAVDAIPVVINEIAWMGSFDNAGASNARNEYVELYNYGLETLDIGGFIFGCSTSARGLSGEPLFALPHDAAIGPGEILTIYRKEVEESFIGGGRYYRLPFLLSNSTRQCLLTDGEAAYFFPVAPPPSGEPFEGHFGDPLFYGNVIDFAGDRSVSLEEAGLGSNDFETRTRRSMERLHPLLPGHLAGSWLSNDYIIEENLSISESYRMRTFGSPGSFYRGAPQ